MIHKKSAAEIEAMARRMEAEIHERHPTVTHFFVDVTADAGRAGEVTASG